MALVKEKSVKNTLVTPLTIQEAPVVAFSAKYVAYAHAFFAYLAFLSALVVGCWLHYTKIVQNSSYGYPDEWFPSVSAAIGDRYPERSVFQVFIACTAGPRFMLIFLNFIVLYRKKLILPYILLFLGLLRTFTCGGWVYITSTDDHDWHDIFMIAYIILTIPWTVTVSVLSPKGTTVRRGRLLTAITFFLTLVPLVYWFIQHKVHVRPGAYSIYAYFEWLLIILDVAFDTWSIIDFAPVQFRLYGNKLEFGSVSLSVVAVKSEKHIEPKKVVKTLEDDFTIYEFLINTTNAFMFWTVLTSLLVCVWYFPLWHMGISGYEAVIFVMFLAPILLAIPPFSYLFLLYPFVARALTVLFGIGAYKVEEPEQRLLVITAGLGFGVIATGAELSSLYHQPRKYTSVWISLLVGLLTTSVFKFMCHSNNPAWPIMHKANGGYNEVAIFVGLAAALLTRKPAAPTPVVEKKGGSLLLAAFGLGGYLFCLQAYLSDSSTMIYWTWEGYPIRGPTPLTGGLFHFAAFALGILASIQIHPNLFASPIYSLFSAASAYVLYAYKGWVGFGGSLGYTFYLSSLAPLVGQAVAGYNIAALFTIAFFVSIVISLASVWIVAYAFVPGGPLLRERTDLIVASSVALVTLAVVNYTLRKNALNITRVEVRGSRLFSSTLKIITVLSALSVATLLHRYPAVPFKPYNESSKSFTTGIWCVHFGLDNDMWSSETRMRDLIKDAEVDIIGLLETDTERLIGGNRDFTQKIADDLGMYVDYGPGPNKHTWGAALLSKFPIVESHHHLLPSPVGELAPAIHATLDIYGELIDVVVFHSGQEEDVEDRRLQSLGVAEIMANSTRPLVLLSYLVTEPLKGNYNTYVSEKTRMYDIDSTDWDRWCEYILFRDLKKVAYARISRSTITDTELQIAKFKFLTDEQRSYSESFLYGNNYIDESEVDPALRMPQLLRGDGVRGHHYHVFDEPRYFAEHT
ncbi:CIC11C00000005210 [Sungouiella intermedia]|uniref:CIC11C00000005210 n=1 Tax=Sungouiella intermedia TaxID=45354 RepID=A0A1L0B9T2_9ASCO|nr:CIC11C00000005210 [[Candida] intermedia]